MKNGGRRDLEAPETFIAKLRESRLKADILTFAQRPPDTTPKFNEPFEWDNSAIADACFQDWWENAASGIEQKRQARRQARGVVRVVPFDDELVKESKGFITKPPSARGRRSGIRKGL